MKVVVTRPRRRADELVERLEALGHEVVVCPLIETQPLGDDPIDVAGYDWVVVTSRTGAEELRRRMRGSPARVAAIGTATADALGGADLVPRVSTQEGLLAELPRPAGRVLFAGAEEARPLLAEALGADVVPLYRTRRLTPEAFPRDAEVVLLASASAAEAYGALARAAPAISIGPQTTAAATAAGVRIVAEATTHDVAGLVDALTRWSSPS
ncbi:MAG: uroporphyrinogen-III synthase [Pseudomonadota bacterium]